MTIYNDINYIEMFNDAPMVNTDKHNYIRFRLGRLKHGAWLHNRKNKKSITIDTHDKFIVDNIKVGRTCVFGSAGYYLDDLIPELSVVERWPIVKKFYPECIIIDDRSELEPIFGRVFDNFIVNNHRGDLWVHNGPTAHLIDYSAVIKNGGLLFYSFRDTQIIFNRLTTDHYAHFYNWAISLQNICGLNLIWHDIKFVSGGKDGNGNDNVLENPDTTNGNLKFVFQYNDDTHQIV
jgi:hypothetical protein